MRTLALIAIFTLAVAAQARSIEGVDFADSTTVEGVKLVLNGVGLRIKRKLMMGFKVYVAGLYAPVVSKEPSALIADAGPRELKLVFLRSVDKKTLVEAWEEGLAKNCKTDCEHGRESLKQFNEIMADVRSGDVLRIDFSATGVAAEMKSAAKATIKDPAFAKSLLSVFIGNVPPTDELKKGLLGL